MGLLYGIALRIVNFSVFFLIIILLPNLPPQTTFPFKEFNVTPAKELKGALEPNYHLEGAERLLNGRLHGPECLIARENEVYTGIHGGEVIKLTADHMTYVTKIGLPCEDISEEARCGRPLGLAFDTQGNNLIVSDAYYGIWLVNLDTHKKKLLVSAQQEQPGDSFKRPAKLFNSVAVDKQGNIYWTDSSSDFDLQNCVYAGFANPSGRLFKYERSSNTSKLLIDELAFANGLVLSPAEDFVVVAETIAMRLTKYYLKGTKAGQTEVFVDGLPGLPDNLTPDAEGIWVPLVMSVDGEHPSGFNMFANFPHVRMFIVRIFHLLELPFKLLNQIYPNKISQRFIHYMGHAESMSILAPKRTTIVRVDWNGNIVGSLHGFDGSVSGISHVLELDEYLLLGSPYNRYLARVKSPKSAKPQTVKVKNLRYEGEGLEAAVKPAAATTSTSTTTSTTTTTTSTTTARPTTTAKPASKPTTTTKAKAKTTTAAPKAPKNPAPVKEDIVVDDKPPKVEKLKVISKEGKHVEL